MGDHSSSHPLRAVLDDVAYRRVRRLILHVGMPRTGTTAVQTALHRRRADLRRAHGVLYPETVQERPWPMHGWLFAALLSDDAEDASAMVRAGLAGVDSDVRTIVLSNENVAARWPEVTDQGRRLVEVLTSRFETEVWIWLRDPAALVAGLWVELLVNPFAWFGRPGSVGELLDRPEMGRVLDYQRVVDDLAAAFGAEAVRVMAYGGDTVEQVARLVGASPLGLPGPRVVNRTPGWVAVRIVRLLDRLRPSPRWRERGVRLALAVDRRAGRLSRPFRLSPEELHRVRGQTEASTREAERRFGIRIVREQG